MIYLVKNYSLKIFIYLSILLLPFQNLSIQVRQTEIDLSNIILSLIVLFFFSQKKINREVFFIFSFIFFNFFIFIFSAAPLPRFISGLYWITVFSIIICLSEKIKWSPDVVEKIILTTTLFSSIICWIQYFYIISPEFYNQTIKSRANAFFSEPSYAGLVFYAVSLSLFFKFFFLNNFKYLVLSLIFFFTGVLTLSIHIVTFFFSFLIIFFLSIILDKNKKKLIFLKQITVFIILLLFFYLILYNYNFTFFNQFFDHILRRLDIFSLEKTNSLSLLSWVRGFDQMLYSIKKTFVIGSGIGSTGEFYFSSRASEILDSYGVYHLTLKDSFSLFFRLVIEIGIFFTLVFLFLILKKLLKFFKYGKSQFFFEKYLFVFIFSFVILLGSLLKEPNYARSTLIVAIFIFFTTPILKKNENSKK
jgi:hypothetical protein